jgi:prepilin-type N-terminal cleavage/methylation domain-containing protein
MFFGTNDFETAKGDSRGFTLAEVLISVSILGGLATAALYFTVGGLASAETQRRGNVAITLAGNAIESVLATSPTVNSTTGVSGIYTGRSHQDTVSRWAVNQSIPGFDRMYPSWDPTAAPGSTPLVPISRGVTVNGTQYFVDTMVGRCYQPLAGGQCGVVAGWTPASPTAAAPAGYIELIRVSTVIWWFAGQGCSAGCSYNASTLIDSNVDLTWLSNG